MKRKRTYVESWSKAKRRRVERILVEILNTPVKYSCNKVTSVQIDVMYRPFPRY